MSEHLFFYPKRFFDPEGMRRAFFARRGRVPVATDVRVEAYSPTRDVVCFSTKLDVSGAFYVPCLDRFEGACFAATGTLGPSREPRSLILELTRGTLSLALRKRMEWGASGLRAPFELQRTFRDVISRFSELATSNRADADFDAKSVATFEAARDVSRLLNEYFLGRALDGRRARIGVGDWATRFGFSTLPTEEFLDGTWGGRGARRNDRFWRRGLGAIFGSFCPAISWADVEKEEGRYDWTAFDAALEWARARKLRTTFGPLIRWGRRTTPRWLWGLPNENERTSAAFLRFVDAILARDAGRTSRWIVATNVEREEFGPSSGVRLGVSAEAARRIRVACPNAEAFLGFERPFGDEGRFRRRLAPSPLEFASRIARRRFFDGFYLEMNFGFSRWATAPRDAMEWHRFFDSWSALGTRLSLAVSYPSSASSGGTFSEDDEENGDDSTWILPKFEEDAPEFRVEEYDSTASELLTETPEDAAEAAISAARSGGGGFDRVWSETTQQESVRRFFAAALARRCVDETIWTRLFDRPNAPNDRTSGAPTNLGDAIWSVAPNPIFEANDETDFALGDEAAVVFAEEPEKVALERDYAETETAFDAFPTSGLMDANGEPKPAFRKLEALKHAYFG